MRAVTDTTWPTSRAHLTIDSPADCHDRTQASGGEGVGQGERGGGR